MYRLQQQVNYLRCSSTTTQCYSRVYYYNSFSHAREERRSRRDGAVGFCARQDDVGSCTAAGGNNITTTIIIRFTPYTYILYIIYIYNTYIIYIHAHTHVYIYITTDYSVPARGGAGRTPTRKRGALCTRLYICIMYIITFNNNRRRRRGVLLLLLYIYTYIYRAMRARAPRVGEKYDGQCAAARASIYYYYYYIIATTTTTDVHFRRRRPRI